MKSIFLLLFLAIGFSCLGQNIVDTTYKWNTVIGYEDPYGTGVTETIRFSVDTIIGENSYKKVIRSTDENNLIWAPYGYIRQDGSKVYYKLNASESEQLIYDFSIGINDSVTVCGLFTFCGGDPSISTMTYYVMLVDSIQFGNTFRRQLHLRVAQGCGFSEVERWVDGMGGLSGILHNYNGYVGIDGDLLLCFSISDTLMYMDPQSATCYVSTGLSNIQRNTPEIKVYPNPASDLVRIDIKNISSSYPLEITLVNELGREILHAQRKNGEQEFVLNLAGIPSGIYFYELRHKLNMLGRGKLLKM